MQFYISSLPYFISPFVKRPQLRWIVYRVSTTTVCIDDGEPPCFGNAVARRFFSWRSVGVAGVSVIPAEEFRAAIQDVLIVFFEKVLRHRNPLVTGLHIAPLASMSMTFVDMRFVDITSSSPSSMY
jgi:hypothetical protein